MTQTFGEEKRHTRMASSKNLNTDRNTMGGVHNGTVIKQDTRKLTVDEIDHVSPSE